MTRSELAKGSVVFLGVAVAGFLSVRSVDQRHAIDRPAVAGDTGQTPPTSQAPCVSKDGTWKNWVWANVPMLSPKCR